MATVDIEVQGAQAWLTLRQPDKFNAMSRAMWRALRDGMQHLSRQDGLRCIVIRGAGGHFCAGGDIAEYPGFRFDEEALRQFHEDEVWGALQALQACDVPLIAGIAGNCMGAGIEIASCCDIRIAASSARFGAPIARLGFPMAPRELQLVMGQVGAVAARSMLLEAQVFDASRMHALGFLTRVVQDDALEAEVSASAGRVAALAPGAARAHKQAIRVLGRAGAAGGATDMSTMEALVASAYAYAGDAEHREGIAAFIAKRRPDF